MPPPFAFHVSSGAPGKGSAFYGASAQAMCGLAATHGYALLAFESGSREAEHNARLDE